MKDEYKALIGDYEKQPLKWSNKSGTIGYVAGFDPIDPSIMKGSSDNSFEDKMIEFLSESKFNRRSGRTHLLARIFVHLAITERRTVYFFDHWENIRNERGPERNLRNEIEKYISMLSSEGVEFERVSVRDNQLNIEISYRADMLGIYLQAREYLREVQPSFPNRVNSNNLPKYTQLEKRHMIKYDEEAIRDLLNSYSLTPNECFNKDEEILLIVNKK